MNANKLRICAASVGILLILVVVLALSRCSSQSSGEATQHRSAPAATSTGSTSRSTSSPARSTPQSSSTQNSLITNPHQVMKENWPPSVTPTIHADIITTKMPAEVKSQLFKFLEAYYTLRSSDVRSRRAAHIESLVSKRALPLDLSLSGVPKDATSTLNKIEENHLVAQLDPDNPSQILITVPIDDTLRSQGTVAFQTVQTGTWFEYSASSGWSIIHFTEAVTS